ncbi:MAG: hypothetical protein ACK5LX_07630 [Oscillospiraceae bacterium]
MELQQEIDRIKALFATADANSIQILEALIEQAAHERLYLKKLNAQAAQCGLVKVHPQDSSRQKPLPISAEISRHSATLTNIMDKLMKYLGSGELEEDDGLGEYDE